MPLKGEAKKAWREKYAQSGRKREVTKAWKAAHPEKVREYAKRWAERQPKKGRKIPLGESLPAKLRRKQRRKEWRSARRKAARGRVIKELGARCAHCGIDDMRVLQVDHIRGDGYKLKASSNLRDMEMLKALSRGEVRLRYQVLCANCHCIKTATNGEWKEREVEPLALPLFEWKN